MDKCNDIPNDDDNNNGPQLPLDLSSSAEDPQLLTEKLSSLSLAQQELKVKETTNEKLQLAHELLSQKALTSKEMDLKIMAFKDQKEIERLCRELDEQTKHIMKQMKKIRAYARKNPYYKKKIPTNVSNVAEQHRLFMEELTSGSLFPLLPRIPIDLQSVTERHRRFMEKLPSPELHFPPFPQNPFDPQNVFERHRLFMEKLPSPEILFPPFPPIRQVLINPPSASEDPRLLTEKLSSLDLTCPESD